MPGLLIKDFPPELHQKLKAEAARYHRSMTRQALVLLEQALSTPKKNRAVGRISRATWFVFGLPLLFGRGVIRRM